MRPMVMAQDFPSNYTRVCAALYSWMMLDVKSRGTQGSTVAQLFQQFFVLPSHMFFFKRLGVLFLHVGSFHVEIVKYILLRQATYESANRPGGDSHAALRWVAGDESRIIGVNFHPVVVAIPSLFGEFPSSMEFHMEPQNTRYFFFGIIRMWTLIIFHRILNSLCRCWSLPEGIHHEEKEMHQMHHQNADIFRLTTLWLFKVGIEHHYF